MIDLEKITIKEEELYQIAIWRNQSLDGLRTVTPTDPSLASQSLWIKRMAEKEKYFYIYKPGKYGLGLTLDNFIGYCGLDKICKVNRTAELSILIGAEHRRKGFGTEAVKEMFKKGFTEYELRLIFVEVFKTRRYNWHFWAGLGIKREAKLRYRKYWNGSYYPAMMGSITEQEWREIYK